MAPKFNGNKEQLYGLLTQATDSSDNFEELRGRNPKSRLAFYLRISCLLNILLSFISIALLVAITQMRRLELSSNYHLRLTNQFSPLLQRLDLPLHSQIVNGSFFNSHHSIYRDEPSPAVDAAWDTASKIGIFTISNEEVKRLGKDPSRTVKAPQSWGQGDDAHLAELDSQHTLHCLNVVRKFAYFDHYYGPKYNNFSSLPIVRKHHLSHCLYIVLQTLMCRPSTGVITFDWVRTQHNPFPDFNIQKQCVSHDAILKWQEGNNLVTKQRWDDISPPKGAYIRAASPELLAWEAAS